MTTHRERILKRFGLPTSAHLSLYELATLSKVPYQALRECFDRGIGAWRTNIKSVRLKQDFSKNPDTAMYPRSARLTKEQWAYARCYSFIDKGKTFYTADRDIAVKYGLL
jgi:hypothetical protein